MSPRHTPNQISLFGSTSDVVTGARESSDEKEWKRERSRRSKRHQVKAAPMPETGPCCGRCKHWTSPGRIEAITGEKEGYGRCAIRVVTTERVVTPAGIIEKGICLGRDDDRRLELGPKMPLKYPVPWTYQHCGPAWSCSGFADASEVEVAA